MINLNKIHNKNETLKNAYIDNGYNKILINLLVNRGYDEETIDTLLTTGYSDIPAYNNLTNVEVGADLIESHIANNSTIYIYGDYDSDGVNASYILGDALNNIIYYSNSDSQLGIHVPERHEGYGLNMEWCKKIIAENQGEDVLVITVDNGIAQDKEVAYLLENNIDVLITDHHTPNGNTPENVWIIDAFHNNDDDNNKGLCGAGVAYKLAMTLLDRYDIPTEVMDELFYKYIVHVAIATITDSMPMTIDNIKYVYNGVQLLKDGHASEALDYYREYNKNTDLTPKDIAFGIGPQINACGRMNNTKLALNYLFADNTEVEDLYNEVIITNEERKDKTKTSIQKAESLLDETPSIILQLDNVEGIGGIIASNLSNKYNKCTIIFSKDVTGKYLVGSARSEGTIDILSLLRSINNGSVVKVGGHSNACGLTIIANKFDEFKTAFNDSISMMPVTVSEVEDINIVIDDFITIADINKDNCDAFKDLYFFTETAPVFAFEAYVLGTKHSGKNYNNIMFKVQDKQGDMLDFWSWGIGNEYVSLGEPKKVTFVGEIEYKFGKPSFNVLNIIPMEWR
jgi:single-stranded-DNA-specific exonuclease